MPNEPRFTQPASNILAGMLKLLAETLAHPEDALDALNELAKQSGLLEQEILAIARRNQFLEQELETVKKALGEKIRDAKEQANLDDATGLYRRSYFASLLYRFMKDLIRNRRSIADAGHEMAALCVLDLDKLKQVNDILGHLKGDQVILMVADLLKRDIRKHEAFKARRKNGGDFEETASRFGGDEFVMLYPQVVSWTDVKFAADRVRYDFLMQARSDKLVIAGEEVTLTQMVPRLNVSIGIAILKLDTLWGAKHSGYPELGEAPQIQSLVDQWLQAADEAMYECKQHQPFQTVVKLIGYDPDKGGYEFLDLNTVRGGMKLEIRT